MIHCKIFVERFFTFENGHCDQFPQTIIFSDNMFENGEVECLYMCSIFPSIKLSAF